MPLVLEPETPVPLVLEPETPVSLKLVPVMPAPLWLEPETPVPLLLRPMTPFPLVLWPVTPLPLVLWPVTPLPLVPLMLRPVTPFPLVLWPVTPLPLVLEPTMASAADVTVPVMALPVVLVPVTPAPLWLKPETPLPLVLRPVTPLLFLLEPTMASAVDVADVTVPVMALEISLLATTPFAPFVPVAVTAGVPGTALVKVPGLAFPVAWAVPVLLSSYTPAPLAAAATPSPLRSNFRRHLRFSASVVNSTSVLFM